MADNGTGPQGVASYGSGTTNPADGNNRRKALLQLLMQKAGGGLGGQAGSAVGSTPFGGLRAVPAHRDSTGQGFTRPAQVAAQFVGGLGVGARPGSNQGGSNGAAVSRFLPSDGGPVQRHVGGGPSVHSLPQSPQAPSAPAQDASAPVDYTDPSVNAAAGTVDQYSAHASGQAIGTPVVDAGFNMFQGDGSTPTSGASNFIPLGNGAYFDPATGTVHYPHGTSAQ